MKKRVLMFALIAMALVVVAIFAFGRIFGSTQSAVTPTATFPIASSTSSVPVTGGAGQTGVQTPAPQTMSVRTRDGGSLTVLDFLHNGVTQEDIVNPGTYFLAGSAGYCLHGQCPHGASSTDFVVTYETKPQFFTITLTQEPLGTARLHAEAFLLDTLGINRADLCSIDFYLGTVIAVNETYAGDNLGFSYCPYGTSLPQ